MCPNSWRSTFNFYINRLATANFCFSVVLIAPLVGKVTAMRWFIEICKRTELRNLHKFKTTQSNAPIPMRFSRGRGSGQNVCSLIAEQLMVIDSFLVGHKQVHTCWLGGHSISPMPKGHSSPAASALNSPKAFIKIINYNINLFIFCSNLLVTLAFSLLLLDTWTYSEIIPRTAVNIPLSLSFMMPAGSGRSKISMPYVVTFSGFLLPD